MNEVVIYQSLGNQTQIDIKFEGDTVWLNRLQPAVPFGRDIKTIP
ncbi:MAG: hypothetical protein QM668_03360 [Agriterribacter sp.]